MANTLYHYGTEKITLVKSFIVQTYTRLVKVTDNCKHTISLWNSKNNSCKKFYTADPLVTSNKLECVPLSFNSTNVKYLGAGLTEFSPERSSALVSSSLVIKY
jgi:hypothetical protein